MTLPRNATQPALVSTETQLIAAKDALDVRVTAAEATLTTVDTTLIDHTNRIGYLEAAPPTHGSTHAIGGTDPIPLTLATVSSNGYLRQLSGNLSDVLRGDGTWGAVAGSSTDLTYTASTRLLESSTGADVTLPLVTSTNAGLAPASGGGTTNFLRADGSWAAPSGGGGVTDHGLLTGLADDDHTQYVLANGTRSGWPTPTTASAANGVPKADANGRISKDWLPEASLDDFQKAGTTNYTAFYAAGAMTGTALSNWALTANRLYAIPFLSPRRGAVIDQLSAYVSTGVASTNIRFGLYNNKSESELYPDTLFYDAGAFTSTTTNQSRDATGLALTLEPSKIYWAVIVGNGTPSLRAVAAGGGSYIMGLTATNVSAPTVGLYATFTYGALPATFPTAGFTANTNTHPTLFYKLSS